MVFYLGSCESLLPLSKVVELAHLTHLPPWFQGIRIYFPDMPEAGLCDDLGGIHRLKLARLKRNCHES